MTLNILNIVDAAEPATLPPVLSQTELVDLHQQLMAATDRGHEFLDAARIVHRLSSRLERCDEADPRTVSLVLTHLVAGLRRGPLRPAQDVERFRTTEGWLDHLQMQQRAQRQNSNA